MTQAELTQGLTDLKEQVSKIGVESSKTLEKVAELQAVIDGMGNVSPELQAAFDALKAQVQVTDDLIPDAAL